MRSLTIRNNSMALFAHRNMLYHQKMMARSMERLSSGYRINRAADDPAGLAVSEKMRGQIRGMQMAVRNTQDMVSMLQTAEGGMQEMHNILHRMRELAVQASNGTYDEEDRLNITKEYDALKEELGRLSRATHFNGIRLLDGTGGGVNGEKAVDAVAIKELETTGLDGVVDLNLDMAGDGSGRISMRVGEKVYHTTVGAGDTTAAIETENGDKLELGFAAGSLRTGVVRNVVCKGSAVDLTSAKGANESSQLVAQVGANGGADQRIGIHIANMAPENLGVAAGNGSVLDSSIDDPDSANKAIDTLEKAINQVSSERAGIGAQINRLGHTLNNLENSIENLTAAESTIRDADMAQEMMNFVRHNILMQAAQYMMAHAAHANDWIIQMLRSL